jgi:hypothetical protein
MIASFSTSVQESLLIGSILDTAISTTTSLYHRNINDTLRCWFVNRIAGGKSCQDRIDPETKSNVMLVVLV